MCQIYFLGPEEASINVSVMDVFHYTSLSSKVCLQIDPKIEPWGRALFRRWRDEGAYTKKTQDV